MGRLTDSFNTGTPVEADEGHLRAWCWDHNKWAATIGLNRWYYVDREKNSDGSETLVRRLAEGALADEIKTVLEGRRIEYMNWEPEKLTKLERKARALMNLGMPA
mgnify:CR=1 FL=1